MNIRYRFQNTWTGEIHMQIIPLETIERGLGFVLDGYKILSRDIGTGMMDKNGKEIFERDRLGRDKFSPWIVIWKPGGFLIYNECNPGITYPIQTDLSEREVIGRSD